MEQIVRADIAAFGAGRAEMANAMIEQSGMRVRPDRNRGRSAGINPSGRFEPVSRHVFDDGWNSLEELPPFKTEVQVEKPRTIITRNESPDISFDRSINPYRGCEHGCVYCFARPTHSLSWACRRGSISNRSCSPSRMRRKLLDKELSKDGYQPRTIAIGTNTDPYQPIEKQYRIMREILEVLEARGHPVGIVTKSALVTRDIDILSRMAERGLAKVALSVTTLDRMLARTMEPRASTPTKRLEAIRQLTRGRHPDLGDGGADHPRPHRPGDRAHPRCGARRRRARGRLCLLRLPLEVSPIFKDWLLRHYPDRYRHVMSLIRSMRDGKDYDSEWGKRMKGAGPYAWQIGRRFEIAAQAARPQRRDGAAQDRPVRRRRTRRASS